MKQYGALRLALSQTWLYQAREIYSQQLCSIESLTCAFSLLSVCKNWPIHVLPLIRRHLRTESPIAKRRKRPRVHALAPMLRQSGVRPIGQDRAR